MAWIDPQFLEQQLENIQPKKQVSTRPIQHLTEIKYNPISTADQTVNIESPEKIEKSPPKPTVADKLELNDLRLRLKSTMAENTKLNNLIEK